MDFCTFISFGSDEKLKCFVCRNYLSYFPIYVCSNNQSMCGRCVTPEGITSQQDEAFETICKFMKFPCRYQSEGCNEKLQPEKVPEHEKRCSFRTVLCVLKNPSPCPWSGSLHTLIVHCQDAHPDVLLKKGEFEVNLVRSGTHDYLIEDNNSLFIFTKEFNPRTKTFRCAVYSNQYQRGKSATFQVDFMDGSTTLTHTFRSSTFEDRKFVEVSLLSLSVINEDKKSILGKIIMEKTKPKDPESRNSDRTVSFKCFMCLSSTTSPHYRLERSLDVICEDCCYCFARGTNDQ